MFRRNWIGLLTILAPAFALPAAADEDADGWNEATGVNLTLDEGFGARHSGMAVRFAGFQTGADAVANAPAAMNDVDDFTFSTAHAERFGEAKYDHFALLVPFEARSTLGIGVSRYGVSNIDLRPDDVKSLDPQPVGLFSIADYQVVAAFARRWGNLDVGGNLNLLYRQLDQDGFGMRADAMVQYTVDGVWRVGALLKGLIPSSAAWESGYAEYEPSDLHLGIAARIPAPYFYGTLQAAYQTEGLFQKRGKSMHKVMGSRFHEAPVDHLLLGDAGIEFLFDFGLAARFGLSEIRLGSDVLESAAFGIGYTWRNILGLDYSFAPHPDLLASHRIALQFTPAFPRFNGRGFRPGRKEAAKPAPVRPSVVMPAADEPGVELREVLEKPPIPPPPAAPAAPAPPAPSPAAVPAPAASPSPGEGVAPAPETPEQLETEELEETE